MLRFVLEEAGFRVVDAQARDVRRGEVDLAEFVQRHDACVVLYDIAIPYDENWRALQERGGAPALGKAPFVLTPTNQRALEGVGGPTDAVEIIGKPYDLHRVVD